LFRGVEVEIAFQFLKASFIIALFLIHVDLSKLLKFLEMDAFDFALGVVLSQFGE
jgi:hypothetical protein